MDRKEFRQWIGSSVRILDGATGTELQKLGMPPGVCPELWVLDHPASIQSVQRAYREAGSDILYTCTFGANRIKLQEFGLESRTGELNESLARLSVQAAEGALVAGDMSPTGRFVEPFGDLPFETAVDVYAQQARGLAAGGVDLFVVETMIDIQEARAAVLGIRSVSDLPIMVSMTYSDQGRTLTGSDPLSSLITLQSLGVDAVGMNCSTGPEEMVEMIKSIKPYATVPLFAKPNAGLPILVDGKTRFSMGSREFKAFVGPFVDAGVNILGGCCGTSPDYIRLVSESCRDLTAQVPERSHIGALSSIRSSRVFQGERPLDIIGERINPTGKKALQAELSEGKFALVRKMARDQETAGASLLDVNMGLPGGDEKSLMVHAVGVLSSQASSPLVIDSSDPSVIEAALRLYPGRALVNSISLEAAKEPLWDIAKRYGAMVLLLPLDDQGIPRSVEERIRNTEGLIEKAMAAGFEKEDLFVDALILTASSDSSAPSSALQFIGWCREQGIKTVCGLSNVSFGLPERKWVNGTFLAMAQVSGLSAAIANPSSDLLMTVKSAGDLLMGRDRDAKSWIGRMAGSSETKKSTVNESRAKTPYDAVLDGDSDSIEVLVREQLDLGVGPKDIMEQQLVPAINRVGDLYEDRVYFLPQLVAGADAMNRAFDLLEPLLAEQGPREFLGRIVIATVKGDIHDIGKNIVAIMFKNAGFEVIDLGKDVSPELIISSACETRANIVCLSALMTTTMTEMEKVISMGSERGLEVEYMVGGAVVTSGYAESIGAHYSSDGVDAVRVAKKLVGGKGD